MDKMKAGIFIALFKIDKLSINCRGRYSGEPKQYLPGSSANFSLILSHVNNDLHKFIC